MNRDEIMTLLSAHRDKLTELKVKRLALFGSVARGEDRPDSDVDVLVEFTTPPTYTLYCDVKEFVEGLVRRQVDLVTFTGLKPRAKNSALSDAVYVT